MTKKNPKNSKKIKFLKKSILVIFGIFFLTSCGTISEKEKSLPKTEKLEAKSEEIHDLNKLSSFIFDKLKGQKLIRNYGEDTGWTEIIFDEDGNFHGSYLGSIKSDGFDGGLDQYAKNRYLVGEIHESTFEGKFKLVKQVNDYVLMMQMEDFTITSKYGAHDGTHFNVDFALGIKADADYYLFIPKTPEEFLPKEQSKLKDNYKLEDSTEDKTDGFILRNKYQDEVFNQLHYEWFYYLIIAKFKENMEEKIVKNKKRRNFR